MISKVRGILESVESQPMARALISPQSAQPGQPWPGITLEVLIPAYLAQWLEAGNGLSGDGSGSGSAIGRLVALRTICYLEGQAQGASFTPRLLGFGSGAERSFFELLTSVKGLGNKRALRALTIEPGFVARAIVERDTRVLQKLPEIGPKLAESIVHELKNKAEPFVGLRAHVEIADQFETHASTMRIEPKPVMIGIRGDETLQASAGNKVAQSRKSSPGSSTSAGSVVPGDGASTAKPIDHPPPIRAAVQALIGLGESAMEAERIVARAVDKAAAAGELSRVTTISGLIHAAYAAR